MNIRGIYKTTLIDYPGRISTAIFTGGCNLRCRYCHNPALVLPGDDSGAFSEEEILDLLRKRKNIIEGLTITGGEPTLNDDLGDFMEKIKALGLEVKLDTNGLRPDVISDLAGKKLIDYVAVDIKTSPDKYRQLTGKEVRFSLILETINILRDHGIQHELRTTCVPEYVTGEDFRAIKESIGYVDKYALQQFVTDNCLIDNKLKSLQPYPLQKLHEFRDFILTFAGSCEIRGV